MHIEQTYESFTECVKHIASGTGQLSLGVNHRTLCDSRLPREQAILLMARFADFAKTFVGQQRVERRDEEEMVDETAVMHVPFVEDHPQEFGCVCYQPPLLARMACS